jgi:hypothetical protein
MAKRAKPADPNALAARALMAEAHANLREKTTRRTSKLQVSPGVLFMSAGCLALGLFCLLLHFASRWGGGFLIVAAFGCVTVGGIGLVHSFAVKHHD